MMMDVALTKAERQRADDLIQRLLDLVDDGELAADGPAGVALVRRMEGTMIALRAMDGPVIPTVETGTNGDNAEKSGDSESSDP
jgi:hypothetical protein